MAPFSIFTKRQSLKVVFHQRTDAVVHHLVEIVVVLDTTVGVDVSVGASGPFILETDVEGFDIVADGGSDTVNAVEVGEILTTLHVDAIVVGTEIIEILPCTEVLHIAEEEVVAHLFAIGYVEVADGGTQRCILPGTIGVDIGDAIAHQLVEVAGVSGQKSTEFYTPIALHILRIKRRSDGSYRFVNFFGYRAVEGVRAGLMV